MSDTPRPADNNGNKKAKKDEETDPKLIAWECFGLSAEEHMHAQHLHLKNTNIPTQLVWDR